MLESQKKRWAKRYAELLKTMSKKKAMLQVRQEIAAVDEDLPNSRAQIYVWCKRFKVPIF